MENAQSHPWQQCEAQVQFIFHTGLSGEALRCKHMGWNTGMYCLTARPARYLLMIQSEGQQVPWTFSDMQHLMHGHGC